MKKTLQKNIAEKLGISVSQVSRALNHREYVSDEIRVQVLKLAAEMNYHNCSWRHKKRLAVLVNSFSDFNVHLLNQILIRAETEDCFISIIHGRDIEQLNDQMFDGAFAISRDAAQLSWNEKFRMPLVILNQYGDPSERISSIFPDADHEVRTAMEHFLSLGHRRIARIRFHRKNSTERELLRGVNEFYRIADNYGIRTSVCNLCVEDFESEITSVLELADQGFTAFLVVMSDWSPRLLHAIRQSGRTVPDDISLITYEYKGSAYQNPPLTTLQYDYQQLVKTAFDQILKEIAGEKPVAQVQIPCCLIIRNSTAAPPGIRKKSARK